jgi:hypothetical protein
VRHLPQFFMKSSSKRKNAQRSRFPDSLARLGAFEARFTNKIVREMARSVDVEWSEFERPCGCDICESKRLTPSDPVRVYEVSDGKATYFTSQAEVALGLAIVLDRAVKISSAVLPRAQFEAIPQEQRISI